MQYSLPIRLVLKPFLLTILLLSTLISHGQPPCNPPIPFNVGQDTTISCGGSAQLGQVITSTPPNYTLAPTCLHTARFQSNSLTQGGGIYINDVTTTGGNVNINNTNTLLDVGHIDPMGPNAWSTIWLSDYSATHFVEACSGSTFNINVSAKSLYNNKPYFCRIWVDWNNDGAYAASEIVYTSPAVNTHPNIILTNIPVTVPTGQAYGAYRMRIRFKDNAPFVATDGGCTYTNANGIVAPYGGYTGNQTGSYTFSDEIEDYAVHVNCGNTGGGNYTYNWSPPAGLNSTTIPNPVATPAQTTTYTITITDVTNNCITTGQITVTIPQVTPTFTNPGPICSGDNLTLPTQSIEGIAGTWSPAPNNTATTTYTFTPTNSTCATTTTMTVVVNNQTTPTFTSVGPFCPGSLFTLPTTSNEGIVGTWSPTINNTQTTTYTFTPTNSSCATTTTMTVVIQSQVTPTFSAIGPFCPNTAYTLPSTSNEGITGTWSPAVNNTATTTYTFTPSSSGCATTTDLTVTILSQAIPTFNPIGPFCPGSTFSLPTTSIEGVTGTWSPAVNNIATTTYTFTPINSNCASTTTMTVVIQNQVSPTFNTVGPFCSGSSFSLPTLSAEGISGTWSPAVNNTATTTYTFSPTNSTCATSTSISVVINQPFAVQVTPVDNVCAGENINSVTVSAIGGTSPYTFNYSLNGGTTQSVISSQNSTNLDFNSYTGFNVNAANCYNLTIAGVDNNTCTSLDSTYINFFCVYPSPTASFTISGNEMGIYTTNNTSSNATNYSWSFSDNSASEHTENITHQFNTDHAADYSVYLIASNTYGCADTTRQVVTINEELIFYVPNSFTPDGDENNNTFFPIMTSGYDPYNYNMMIFDRWGELIFESNSPLVGWDGTYHDQLCQDGTYTWKISFKIRHTDDHKEYVGHVNIIR